MLVAYDKISDRYTEIHTNECLQIGNLAATTLNHESSSDKKSQKNQAQHDKIHVKDYLDMVETLNSNGSANQEEENHLSEINDDYRAKNQEKLTKGIRQKAKKRSMKNKACDGLKRQRKSDSRVVNQLDPQPAELKPHHCIQDDPSLHTSEKFDGISDVCPLNDDSSLFQQNIQESVQEFERVAELDPALAKQLI